MIQKGKYVFKKYDKIYPLLFKKEKQKLIKIIHNAKIEHVGSSAVPELGGKGIIDIAIKTPKNKVKQFIKKLELLGYEYNPEHQRNNKRIFLQKKVEYSGKERRIHIHLTLNNNFWDSFIIFRDYLRANKDIAKKYAKIKKEAVRHAKGEGKKYREYKKSFLENLQKIALKEYLK